MKKDKIKRFTMTEVVLHWLHAVLYLVLAVTGVTMLLLRVFEVQILAHRTLPVVHRVTGIILVFVLAQTFLLSLFARIFRQFWMTLRECLSWSLADILWLLKVPLNMFSSRISLPPVGRFNPGQKLHILVVFVVLIGFCFSGLAIMLIPGALAPWIIHLACFVPAAFFLLLHLFLALINPQTRKSLSCIFTGFISRDYAKVHHALLLDKVDSGTHKPYVSWRAALIFLLTTGILSGAVVWRHGFGRFADNMNNLIARHGASLIMPGGLCASHAEEEQTRQCRTCHRAFGPISSDACLKCHENIGRIIAQRIGYHGTLSGPCRECHTEHCGKEGDIRLLDTAAFNHNLARFGLDGKHRELSCDECHLQEGVDGVYQRTRYIGLDFTACSDCHTDPHKNQFTKDCDTCHSEQGWKGRWLVDAHGPLSPYPLRGRHAAVDCLKCHIPSEQGAVLAEARFAGLSRKCDSCHEDPHSSQMRSSCDTCHTEQGWKGQSLLFVHDQHSEFKIDRIHTNVPCASCHTRTEKPLYRPLPKTCELCHTDIVRLQLADGYPAVKEADPHANRVSCVQCHPPDRQSQKPAEYARACEACHNRHYSRLFYNWTKSFDNREYQARKILEHLRKHNAPKAEALEQRIKQARSTGFHNLVLALKLWDEILVYGFDENKQKERE